MYHITFLLVLLDNVVIYPFYDGELRKHNKSRDVGTPLDKYTRSSLFDLSVFLQGYSRYLCVHLQGFHNICRIHPIVKDKDGLFCFEQETTMKNVPESHHLHFTVDRVISLTTPNGMCIPYIVRLFLLAYLRMLILDAFASSGFMSKNGQYSG